MLPPRVCCGAADKEGAQSHGRRGDDHPDHDRALRRSDRRGGNLGGGRRLSPDQAVPRHQLRRPGGAGELWRHLDHPPLPGHPVRQRPAHLRLSLQAVARRADRHGSRDPELHGRGHRGERPRPAHPLSAPDRLGELVERGQSLDDRSRRGATPARRSASPRTSCGCARATTAIPRATRRTGTAWRRSRAGSSTRRTGPTIWTTAASRSW